MRLTLIELQAGILQLWLWSGALLLFPLSAPQCSGAGGDVSPRVRLDEGVRRRHFASESKLPSLDGRS